jgi:hypothetical protein
MLPLLKQSTMNHFLDEHQVEEFIPYDWDDEQTRFEISEQYDDLADGLPLCSSNDF